MSRYCTVLLVASSLVIGCDSMGTKKDKGATSGNRNDATSMKSRMNDQAAVKTAVATIKPSKAATTQPVANNVMGTITFTQAGDSMKVAVNLTGLPPNSTHGFHIHEKSDLSAADLMSAGLHFNPAGHKHGGPNSPMAHAGDFGNITSDANGNVNTEMTVKGITLDNSPTGVIGRSVIVHAKVDDLKTDPSGNSGARVAGGVIEAK
ncbi:MAG: superoxide dismutase family protein [Anaerolineae bacterium]|nr:superoxide dismutase family protein [Phycisphaerae bacterium]